MKFTSSLIFLQSFLLVQLALQVRGQSLVSSIISYLSSSDDASSDVTQSLGLRRLSLVVHKSDDDDSVTSGGDGDSTSTTSSVAASTGHGGITTTTTSAAGGDTDDSVDSTEAAKTSEVTSSNSTSSTNSTATDDDDGDDGDDGSDGDVGATASATEEPTLSTDDFLKLLTDDAVQNSTSIIPTEKEQPRGWALTVIIIFLSCSFLLCLSTLVKQCQRRQEYQRVPTLNV